MSWFSFRSVLREVTAPHGTCAPESGTAKVFSGVSSNSATVLKEQFLCTDLGAKVVYYAEGDFNFMIQYKIAERWVSSPRLILGVP